MANGSRTRIAVEARENVERWLLLRGRTLHAGNAAGGASPRQGWLGHTTPSYRYFDPHAGEGAKRSLRSGKVGGATQGLASQVHAARVCRPAGPDESQRGHSTDGRVQKAEPEPGTVSDRRPV